MSKVTVQTTKPPIAPKNDGSRFDKYCVEFSNLPSCAKYLLCLVALAGLGTAAGFAGVHVMAAVAGTHVLLHLSSSTILGVVCGSAAGNFVAVIPTTILTYAYDKAIETHPHRKETETLKKEFEESLTLKKEFEESLSKKIKGPSCSTLTMMGKIYVSTYRILLQSRETPNGELNEQVALAQKYVDDSISAWKVVRTEVEN